MNFLILNAGSNSLKFEIVAAEPPSDPASSAFGQSQVAGVYDDIGKEKSSFSLLQKKRTISSEQLQIRDHGHATELLFDWIEKGNASAPAGVTGLGNFEKIGHRVVHGADQFHGPAKINAEVIRQIEALEDLAPLHNRSALQVIKASHAKIGDRTPMFVVFDTVFHQTIPPEAALYPLPPDLAQRHKIRRYGFHGISHRYLMLRYAEITGRKLDSLNLITLHLEGGSSAAAILRGKSIDTSMGFTPLEGLMMGTRCGDIDPAIVPYLMRKENLDPDGIERLLNKQCGLLGVSRLSADTRELCKHLEDEQVELALTMFSYRVRKYIGAYLAALGGAEAIVVGGGIGENTPVVRERIFKNLHWFGAILDPSRNASTIDREGLITTPDSKLQIWVIPTQEGLMIARDLRASE